MIANPGYWGGRLRYLPEWTAPCRYSLAAVLSVVWGTSDIISRTTPVAPKSLANIHPRTRTLVVQDIPANLLLGMYPTNFSLRSLQGYLLHRELPNPVAWSFPT